MTRRVLLWKKCVHDIGKGEYGSRMYSYHCNGKWLMDFHGSLCDVFVCLEYERKIRRKVHTRTI